MKSNNQNFSSIGLRRRNHILKVLNMAQLAAIQEGLIFLTSLKPVLRHSAISWHGANTSTGLEIKLDGRDFTQNLNYFWKIRMQLKNLFLLSKITFRLIPVYLLFLWYLKSWLVLVFSVRDGFIWSKVQIQSIDAAFALSMLLAKNSRRNSISSSGLEYQDCISC